MVFSSPIFLFFFLPIVLGLHLLAGKKLRNLVLLVASLFFYAWGEGKFVVIMLFSISFNYLFGIALNKTTKHKKLTLCFGITCNLGLIGFYKYGNFVVDNLNIIFPVFGLNNISLNTVHLPIGISFFTFQAISYIIDVYRDEKCSQKNPINVALYIALFPQLIAGPIVRYHDVISQIINRRVNLESFSYGIKRFTIGLGKKVLIANSVAVAADKIFAIPPDKLTFELSWLGIIAYTLQIYFDFSGYSDMAIGLGHMLGFSFLENFNYPYISKSIKEFWRRWHISLSSWFKDYLYIPLGGSRCSTYRVYFNLLTVFFLCGLWHGASWNFVFWGLFHGFFLLLERLFLEKLINTAWKPLRHIYALTVIAVGWVFFRSESLSYAFGYLKTMLWIGESRNIEYLIKTYLNKKTLLAIIVGIIASTDILHILLEWKSRFLENLNKNFTYFYDMLFFTVELTVLCLILISSTVLLASGTYNPFIYFQF